VRKREGEKERDGAKRKRKTRGEPKWNRDLGNIFIAFLRSSDSVRYEF